MNILSYVLCGLVAAVCWAIYSIRRFPPINDVTTTPENPPQYHKAAEIAARQGRNMDYPKTFQDIQRRAYPDLAPVFLQDGPDAAFLRVQAAAKNMPRWSVLCEDPVSRRLEAVAITTLMRYRDDVVIQVRPETNGSSIHMRSKSRIGRGDLGANASRIRSFLKALRVVSVNP